MQGEERPKAELLSREQWLTERAVDIVSFFQALVSNGKRPPLPLAEELADILNELEHGQETL